MNTLQSVLTEDIKQQIVTYNTNMRMNSFLAKDKECNDLLGIDRFDFVTNCNKIERELTPIVHELYHGKKVIVKDRNGKELEGTIRHELLYTYDNRTMTNNVSFRREYEDETFSAPETIALWVVIPDNKHDSHLYPSTRIYLLD